MHKLNENNSLLSGSAEPTEIRQQWSQDEPQISEVCAVKSVLQHE